MRAAVIFTNNVFTMVVVLCLLADRPTARFCRCRLSPSPSFRPYLSPGLRACVLELAACCAQIMNVLLFWCFVLGYFAHYKIVHEGENRRTKNTTSSRRSILVDEASWYNSLDLCNFTSSSPSFGKLQLPKVWHCGIHVHVVMTQASTH